MSEQRRAEVRIIVDHFYGMAVTENLMKEFCNLKKIDPVSLNELEDYIVQVNHDEKVGRMFPLILKELQNCTYSPEYAPAKVRKAIMEKNNDARINVAKIFEEHAVDYTLVETLGTELGRSLGQMVASAGVTVFNKGLEVMLHLAKAHFGGTFNAQHAAEYAEKVIRKAKEK